MATEKFAEQQNIGDLRKEDPCLLFFKQNATALIGAALILQICFLGTISFLTATAQQLDAAVA